MLYTAVLLMQFMISAKAGLVNDVEGQANVSLHEQVPAGTPIQTGPQGHVEILLNPGSFLRLDENSTVVLDSVELIRIAIRVVSGTVLIESAEIDKQTPIHVTTGNLRTLIVSPGLYRFSGDTASVIDGKLRTADSSMTLKKGEEVTAIGNRYKKSAVTVDAGSAELDRWSERRSAELSKANTMAYREGSSAGFYSYGGFPYWALFPNRGGWLYSPLLSGFTFIPRYSYRSYWGYSFVPLFVFAGRGLPRTAVRPSRPPVTSGTPPQPPAGRIIAPGSRPRTGAGPGGASRAHGGHGGMHARR